MKMMISGSVLACTLLAVFFLSHKEEQEKKKQANLTYYWWDFSGGGVLDQYDQSYYTLDDDQSPDCGTTTPTLVNCEIFAMKDAGNPNYPDMATVASRRYPQQK